jgi:hypothetical protein
VYNVYILQTKPFIVVEKRESKKITHNCHTTKILVIASFTFTSGVDLIQ